MRRCTTFFLAVLILTPMLVQAQPNLNLKRVVVNWPAVELYFSVGCNGTPAYNMLVSDFRVYDNGEEMTPLALSCPDPTQACAMSVALVFDASGSMAGTGNAGAIAGGEAFVQTMDGQNDEAAVIWFNSNTTLQQGMTADTSLLNVAVRALPAIGATAVWDALYAGLVETALNGSNSCRAVVLLTDGMDNSSTRMPSEIIAFANANHIRVFTIGLGSSINGAELQQISSLTGGRYYQTSNATQLPMIYQEISTIIHMGFQECSLVYDATCADGSFHTVEVQLVNFCGGTDTKSKTYRAPIDSSTFSTLSLRLGDVQTSGDADFELPLLIDTTLAGQSFPQLTIDLCFNSHVLGFRGAEIPIGSPLNWMQVLTSPTSCGIRLQTEGAGTITGSGELLRLKFHTNVSPPDTAEVDVTASYARLETGCLQPVVSPATVTIVPGSAVLSCDMDAPRSVTWDTLQAAYTPSPFEARLRIFNTGTVTAYGGSCEISIDSTVLRRVSPTAATATIPDIPPGEFREAIWLLDVLPQATADSADITMTASFSNHGKQTCFIRQYIGASEPILVCDVSMPRLTADSAAMRYDPNPFTVTVTVRNDGVVAAQNVQVMLEHPSEMSLAGPDLGGPFVKPAVPSTLQPGQSGVAVWQLYHPPIPFPHSDTIFVAVRDDHGGTRRCSGVLEVPPIQGPVLSPRCYVPDSLHFDARADAYVPNPFRVRLSCVNIGTDTARDVTARLVLPPGLDLANPAEPLTKTVRAGALGPWQIGNAVPEVDWLVRWTKKEDRDIDLPIRFIVGGQNKWGDPLADVPAECSMRIPGLRREFQCTASVPDTLAMNPAGNDYTPNPVPLTLRIQNTGQLPVTLTRVLLAFPPAGLSLDPSSPQGMDVQINQTLPPGAQISRDWLLRVQKRDVPRAPRFEWVVIDATGRTMSCSAVMVIPGLPVGALDCELAADTIQADLTAQSYDPMPFALHLRTRSNKLAVTDSVFARVLLPPGALALAASDAGLEVKPLSPARIFPQQEAQVEWLLEHPVSTTEQRYTVRTLLWEQGGDTSVCETEVRIPAIPAPFWFTLSASGPTSFCDGGEVTLDAGAGFASYLWSTQDTTQSIVVRDSGTYWCGVTASNGLPGLSYSVTVTVFPLPAKPVISRTGDLLATDAAATWQWYLDGTEIPNATTQTLAAVAAGNYTVRITDAHGCEALSDPYQVLVLFVDEGPVAGQRFQIFPNPASGELTVDVNLERASSATIILHDLLGRELRRVLRTDIAASFTQRLDLRGLRPGLYVVQLVAGTMRQSRVLVVR